MSLAFTAQPVAPGVWALRHPLGPRRLVEGGRPARTAARRRPIERALARARRDLRRGGHRYRGPLRGEGGGGARRGSSPSAKGTTREVGRWGPAVSAHVRGSELLARPGRAAPLLERGRAERAAERVREEAGPAAPASGRPPAAGAPAAAPAQLRGRRPGLPDRGGARGAASPRSARPSRARSSRPPRTTATSPGRGRASWRTSSATSPKQAQLDLRLELTQDGVAVDGPGLRLRGAGPGDQVGAARPRGHQGARAARGRDRPRPAGGAEAAVPHHPGEGHPRGRRARGRLPDEPRPRGALQPAARRPVAVTAASPAGERPVAVDPGLAGVRGGARTSRPRTPGSRSASRRPSTSPR